MTVSVVLAKQRGVRAARGEAKLGLFEQRFLVLGFMLWVLSAGGGGAEGCGVTVWE